MGRPDVPGWALYDVNKLCKVCGKEWVGRSFRPPPDDELAVVEATCDDCLNKAELSSNRNEVLLELDKLMSQNPATQAQRINVASAKVSTLKQLRDTYTNDDPQREKLEARVEVAKLELEDAKHGPGIRGATGHRRRD